ncbi:hypothetical protein NDU88_003008 [Pleurodeles waltl]|uniref:Uncharacterized protein n=1 Tax=Pleurodeles waltl TaxID=8319 RepID=A0AAV7W0X9_PLEWA|nr:hypothetical protein NDU88_003008 [Pleurodeles waltl]
MAIASLKVTRKHPETQKPGNQFLNRPATTMETISLMLLEAGPEMGKVGKTTEDQGVHKAGKEQDSRNGERSHGELRVGAVQQTESCQASAYLSAAFSQEQKTTVPALPVLTKNC